MSLLVYLIIYLYFQNTFHWGTIRPVSLNCDDLAAAHQRASAEWGTVSHKMYLPIADIPVISKDVNSNLPLPFQKSPMLCHCTASWNVSQTWSLHFALSIFVNVEKTAKSPMVYLHKTERFYFLVTHCKSITADGTHNSLALRFPVTWSDSLKPNLHISLIV